MNKKNATYGCIVLFVFSPVFAGEAHVVSYASSEWFLVYLTAVLAIVTGLLAFYTYRLYSATVELGREAKGTGQEQMEKMERSVSHAERGAIAMEGVATATLNNATLMSQMLRKQMRAYVNVEAGVAVYQDERLRFEAKPVIVNSGFTPAKNVSFTKNALIVSSENLESFEFPEGAEFTLNDANLVPRQPLTISALLPERVNEQYLQEVFDNHKRVLFVWGTVTYDDVYGESHYANFCYHYLFRRIGDDVKMESFYHRSHNDAS